MYMFSRNGVKKYNYKLAIFACGLLILGNIRASMTLGATPAQAYPSNCSSSFVANGGQAMCNSGTGSVRVVLGCKNLFGFWTNPTGPWVKVGQGASRTGCPIGYGVQWTGFYLKD
jgi:hypothetical protein